MEDNMPGDSSMKIYEYLAGVSWKDFKIFIDKIISIVFSS